MDKEKQLKFPNDQESETLVIESAGYEEFTFGKKYVVKIKETITGHDHFMPSEGLIKKLKEQNVDKGDQIKIKKVGPSEEYQYGYFNVEVVHKGNPIESSPVGAGFSQKDAKHKSYENFEKQFSKDNIDTHELAVRVEKLETAVASLIRKGDLV